MKLGEITETAVVQTAHLAQIPKMGIWVTAEQLVKKIAAENGISKNTVLRAEQFSKGMVDRGWRDGDYVLTDEDYVGVDFKTTGEHELSEKKMLDVLLVKPNEHPRNVSIGAELEDLQQAVGGSIGASYPFADDPVAIVYNDDGKLMGLPLNRALRKKSSLLKNEKIRQPTAAPDKQHSNAGLGTARATERTAKQARPTLAETE